VAGTILYIDDAPELPAGSAGALLGIGYRVVHTADPEHGLRLAREQAPQIVLVELLLRAGDGFELIERIRSWEGLPGQVPIVILTRGERTPQLYGRALELGVTDFLCKPVLRADLLAAVLECGEREAAEEVEPAPREAQASPAAGFSGELGESPLPELLHRLHRMGATGVLIVQSEAEIRAIQVRNGSPIAVTSNRGAEALEDFLVRTKRISGAEHEAVMERVEACLGSPQEILVATGVLAEAELEAALAQRAAEPLLEGFGWSSGSFRFESGKTLSPGRSLDLDQSPARLLFEGALQWAPTQMVRELLRRRARFYLSRADEPPFGLEELGPAACAPEALDALLGDRSLADVLASGEFEERVLYGLIITRFVEVHPEPVLLLRDAVSPAPGAREAEPAGPPPRAQAPDAVAAEGPEPEPSASASPAPSPERAEEASGSRAREAESWFRKGESLLRGKRHMPAAEAFGMAAHLDPTAGEYRAHLGYALHLANPRNELVRREALEHIAQAIKLSPGRDKPLLFLGRVFKAAGDVENARKVFRRALKIRPDGLEAQRELRELDGEAPARKGFLARLLGR
jgi:CheY-like chemotaxis protein/tetratricopeptide (TPR) repeat protein